jgi:hypothetical protein
VFGERLDRRKSVDPVGRTDCGETAVNTPKRAEAYQHDEQALSPSLDWDGQNPVREFGEWLVAQIDEASQLDPPHRFDSAR